jgi:hypothetical protein
MEVLNSDGLKMICFMDRPLFIVKRKLLVQTLQTATLKIQHGRNDSCWLLRNVRGKYYAVAEYHEVTITRAQEIPCNRSSMHCAAQYFLEFCSRNAVY